MLTRSHKRRFQLVFLSTAIILVLILLLLSHTNIRDWAVATLKLSPASVTSTHNPDAWVVRPSFPGKVLHWTLKTYGSAPGNADPNHGASVYQDFWELVGTDGLPSVFRVRYRYIGAGGSFLQEIEETRTRETILTRTYNANYPGGRCTISRWAPALNDLRSLLPAFANENILSSMGYHESVGPPTPQQYGTSSFPGVVPLITYGPGTTVHRWVLRESIGNDMNNVRTMEIGEHDRALFIQDVLTSAQGVIEREKDYSYGSLQVYDSKVVVESIFSPQSCSTALHS